jgi:hypothetical protein
VDALDSQPLRAAIAADFAFDKLAARSGDVVGNYRGAQKRRLGSMQPTTQWGMSTISWILSSPTTPRSEYASS